MDSKQAKLQSRDLFDLHGRVAVVTGGCGLLGQKHAEAIAMAGGHCVLVDLALAEPDAKAARISEVYGVEALGLAADITSPADVQEVCRAVLARLRESTSSSTMRRTIRKSSPRRAPTGRGSRGFP